MEINWLFRSRATIFRDLTLSERTGKEFTDREDWRQLNYFSSPPASAASSFVGPSFVFLFSRSFHIASSDRAFFPPASPLSTSRRRILSAFLDISRLFFGRNIWALKIPVTEKRRASIREIVYARDFGLFRTGQELLDFFFRPLWALLSPRGGTVWLGPGFNLTVHLERCDY